MRALTEREKKTVRLAAIGLVGYLVIFYGFKGWNALRDREAHVEQLRLDASLLETRILKEQRKDKRLKELRKSLAIDLEKLDDGTLVTDTRVAIGAAAKSRGVGIGPTKEAPARSDGSTLTTLQFGGGGGISNVADFIYSLPRLGFPLAIERVQITAETKKPGNVRFTMTVSVLSVQAWKEQTVG